MTEEKKKRRIIKQIFKWLGLGLLVALILGALIYDAPWKVLALLLIMLAAYTILPKRSHKMVLAFRCRGGDSIDYLGLSAR